MASRLYHLEMRIAELSIIAIYLLIFIVYHKRFVASTLIMKNNISKSSLLEK